ncbi:adenosylhomocysteinase [Rhodopseudomonas palustris]|nr:adenosylhomocysteinase [Rhodopseudomonas palustris]RHZ90917.1 hypothetical protein D1920_23585 [Rhodopseudomonas palustris]
MEGASAVLDIALVRHFLLPKSLYEKVARLRLAKIGVKFTKTAQGQADYIGVKVEELFKAEHYRY